MGIQNHAMTSLLSIQDTVKFTFYIFNEYEWTVTKHKKIYKQGGLEIPSNLSKSRGFTFTKVRKLGNQK